jgi:hypothetical protein
VAFPLVGLGLFASVFGSILFRTFSRTSDAYSAIAALPLSRDGGDRE